MCIKQYWNKYKAYIIASAIALAYLIGIKKGKDHEKIRRNKKILQNLERANKARHTVATDSDVVRKLHKKYSRH